MVAAALTTGGWIASNTVWKDLKLLGQHQTPVKAPVEQSARKGGGVSSHIQAADLSLLAGRLGKEH